MKKLKIKLLSSGDYGFTIEGKTAVKKLMMDKETAQIDLLVRESIQNSSDAIKKESRFCIIKYNLKDFNNFKLSNCFENYKDSFVEKYGEGNYKALIITDLFTTGLLGEPYETPDSSNNLFKLVYAFLRGKNDQDSGGSWGIGKSVYFRYGGGVVFYYSRTFENGHYINKLAGTILEDQTSSNRLIQENQSKYCGVGFIGDEGKGVDGMRSVPIYDENEIKEFLSVFGLKPFSGEQTGTSIIIPYFNVDSCLNDRRSEEDVYWDKDFYESLKISIQRWYFAKIMNTKERKYIDVYVDDKQVTLLPFFKKLQDLYNGDLYDATEINILAKNLDENNLGLFRYKKFSNKELDVLTAPNHYPTPYALLDIEANINSESNVPILFYTRKPRMIITYEDKDLSTNIRTEPGQYIIGIFVLNSKARKGDEIIESYFRASENANHKKWCNIVDENFPKLCGLRSKPFSIISKQIVNEINNRFSPQIQLEEKTTNTKLQKEFTEMYLPSEGYGKEKGPSVHRKKHSKTDVPKLVKPKKGAKDSIYFNGFINGKPTYTIQLNIKSKGSKKVELHVSTSSKPFTIDKWLYYGMKLPFFIDSYEIDRYFRDKTELKLPRHLFTVDDPKFLKNVSVNDGIGSPIFIIKKDLVDEGKYLAGLTLSNETKDDIAINLILTVHPLDPFTIFDLDVFDGDENGGDSNE